MPHAHSDTLRFEAHVNRPLKLCQDVIDFRQSQASTLSLDPAWRSDENGGVADEQDKWLGGRAWCHP
jgi:hypothetical protein